MNPPRNTDLPFFAYGLFRPGQLAFFQLRELVREVPEPAEVAGELLVRDGLPIIDPDGGKFVRGALLRFLPERTAEAYERIAAMEPDKHPSSLTQGIDTHTRSRVELRLCHQCGEDGRPAIGPWLP